MTRSNDGREAFLSSSTAKRKTKSRQNLIRKENVEEGWKWGAREMSRSTTGGRTVIWTNRRARERSFFLFLSFLSGEANWLLCRMAVFVSARERADDARGSMSSTNLHFFSVFNNSSHLVIIVFFSCQSVCVCVRYTPGPYTCQTILLPMEEKRRRNKKEETLIFSFHEILTPFSRILPEFWIFSLQKQTAELQSIVKRSKFVVVVVVFTSGGGGGGGKLFQTIYGRWTNAAG